MASRVYYTDLRAGNDQSLLDKIRNLAEAAGIQKVVRKRGLTAVKIHFGERGNTAFIRPLLVRPVIESIVRAGGKPFLTDANTLYVGTRGNAVDHLTTAVLNGFAYAVVGAPLIVADGIDGKDDVTVPLNFKHCKEAFVGTAVARADSIISLAHFKLHEATGFGGAIKNVGMGSASRRGKMAQHSEVSPQLILKNCIGCGVCRDQCAHEAIELVERPEDAPRPEPKITQMARIDPRRCVGCAACIHACPQHALEVDWKTDLPRFMERMVEYTAGALKGKEKHSLFINFLTQISPACDCHSYADAPIVADIGILASRDPVAIDQASMDLVNAQPPLDSSCIAGNPFAREDKVRAVYLHIDWQHQLDYAESVGLGVRAYDLVKA
ncbi:MAG TPA: DUF362 domain-containing protein [Syntrophobacter fumaroxidans]|nr:DUF362 domain-containing protein [Syntrophobacter fumaroxidans]